MPLFVELITDGFPVLLFILISAWVVRTLMKDLPKDGFNGEDQR